MEEIDGIDLDFSDDPETPMVREGKSILPHRTKIIENKMINNDLDELENIFFNFHTPHCTNPSNMEHIIKETELFKEYLKRIGETAT